VDNARKQLSLFQRISTIPRDRLPKMLVRLPILMSRESSMSQLLLHLLSVLTRQMEKFLLYMILEVVLSIFLSLRYQVVYLRSRQPMVILRLEEKILISKFNNSLFKNSRISMAWIFQGINLLFKESEKLLRKQRSNFHQPPRLRSILHIFLLIKMDQSICNSVFLEPN